MSVLGVWILGMCLAEANEIADPEIDQAVARTAADAEARAALEEECLELATTDEDIPFATRYRAFRILEVIGTEQSIEPMAALLGDPERSHLARAVLEKSPDQAADDALVNALATASGNERLGIIGSLGVRRTADAVAPLSALLADAEAATAAGAAAALGRIGTPEALASLRTRLDGTDGDRHKRDVYKAILAAADRVARDGRVDLAVAAYEPLMEPGRPPHIRSGAFRGVLSAQAADAADLAYEAIHGEDPFLRREALAVMAELDGGELAQRLADDFEAFGTEVKVPVLDFFAEWRDPVALPVVNRALGEQDDDVRMAAIRTVAVIGDVSSIEPIGRLLATATDRWERLGAIESLRRIEAPDMDAQLIAYLEQAPVPVRPHIIAALEQRDAVEAVDAIMGQVRHETLRVAAFRALAQLARPEHFSSMLTLLTELEGQTGRREAMHAVVSVSRRHTEESSETPAIEQIIDALDSASDADATLSLLGVLSGVGGRQAFDAAVRYLDDEDPIIYDGAVRALADWPDPHALDGLVGLSRHAREAVHRTVSLRGAVRLLRTMDPSSTETLTRYVILTTSSRNPSELMLIFSGLSEVEHPAGLSLLSSYLNDENVREEAEFAFNRVAEALDIDPETALERLSENGADAAGFLSLFDGESLAGWRGGPEWWRVEDGHIIGQTREEAPLEHNTFLIRDESESDFILKFSYRIDTSHANSGVQIRSEEFEEYRVRGYQPDIATVGWVTGICFEERGRGILARRGQQVHLTADGERIANRFAGESVLGEHIHSRDWNDYQVIALDNRVLTLINGHLMHEVIDDAPEARDEGIIAFQLHRGPPMTIRFQDIRLKRLVGP